MGNARSHGAGEALAVRPRLAVIVNPRSATAANAPLWQRALDSLRAGSEIVAVVETRGDGGDVDRVAALVEETHPDIVAAAGGDGTVGEVVSGVLRCGAPQPAVALFPLGTANDLARSLGLLSFRQHPDRAVDLAVAAAFGGARTHIDAGVVNGHSFAGSFALAMDADILVLRNRLRRRFGLTGNAAGYALYLASCGLNVLSAHGGAARLSLDGAEETRRIYNLTVLNAPIYAGEFRFDGDNDCADGRLDVVPVASAAEYLSEYPRAWRRHLGHLRGLCVAPSSRLRRALEIAVELERPVAAQIDGEEFGRSTSYRIHVLPRAVSVCVPRATR